MARGYLERSRTATRSIAKVAREAAFEQQRAVLVSLSHFILLRCSGRAGKTRAFLLKWLELKEQQPGLISVYTALTRQSARRLAWTQLKQMNKEMRLGLTFNVAELTVTDSKGSQLVLLGANREDLIDVLRGFPILLFGADEAAFWRHGLLRRALDDAVLIRLADYDGHCWVMSTPGYVSSGDYFDLCEGKKEGCQGYELHHWTFFDNPHLPAKTPANDNGTPWSDEQRLAWRVEYARKTRERKGWTEQSPTYVREFLGLYADDSDSLIYKVDRKRHGIAAMPESFTTHRERWVCVLGMDYGSTNATAWVLWAFELGKPDAYMVKARKVYDHSPSQVADITKADWVDVYHPEAIVGDPAAKSYIDELRVRWQIAVENADKLDKRAHQRTFNDALLFAPAPRIHVVEADCEDWLDEAEKLGKNPKYDQRHPKYGAEDPGAENDACDAGLYGYTRVYAWVEDLMAKLEAKEKAAADERIHGDPDPLDLDDQRGDDPIKYVM